jgi:hypothetical protein
MKLSASSNVEHCFAIPMKRDFFTTISSVKVTPDVKVLMDRREVEVREGKKKGSKAETRWGEGQNINIKVQNK